jgi:hypothetical protein
MRGSSVRTLLELCSVIAGSLMIGHAVYRFRHPNWRDQGWWSRHRRLASSVPRFPAVGRNGQAASERIGSIVQFFVGTIFIAGGVIYFVTR